MSEVKTSKPVEYTIYAFMHPVTLLIYYVGLTGKSIGTRMDKHVDDAKRQRKWATGARSTNKELFDAGLEPIIITLDKIVTDDRRFAEDLEFYWINHTWYTGHPIKNSRKLIRDPRGIYVDSIRELHEAIDNGWRWTQFDAKRRCPPKLFDCPFELETFGDKVDKAKNAL